MTTSARRNLVASAMLFGGTLGVTGTAGADLVAGLNVTTAYVYLDANSASNFFTNQPSEMIAGCAAVTTGCSLTLSPFTSSGFTLSATSNGESVWSVYTFQIIFTAQSNMIATLSGDISGDPAMVLWQNNTTSASTLLRSPGDSGAWTSGPINLVAGQSYTLAINPAGCFSGGTETGTVLSFAVPAPGAVALVSLAGLIVGRRRKA